MAECSCKCINRKSCPGYTYITNNVAQTVSTNRLVMPGSVVRTSCIGTVVPTGNNSLTIKKTGTYMISVQLIGTPTAPAGSTATTGTIQPTITVNGTVISSAVVPVAATNYDAEFFVRVISPICCGDVVTISNLGTFTLTMAESNTLGGYNVNIVVERFN